MIEAFSFELISKKALIVIVIILIGAVVGLAAALGFGVSSAGIALVQSTEGSTPTFSNPTPTSPVQVVFSANTRSGDILVVLVSYYQSLGSGTPSVNAPTDTQGNSYSLASVEEGAPGCTCYLYSAVYYASAGQSSGDTVSVAFSSPSGSNPALKINVFEISGACACIATSSGESLNTEVSSASVSNFATPSGSAVFASNTGIGQGGGVNAGSGYTICGDESCEYLLSSSSSVTAPFTYGANNYYVEAAVSFSTPASSSTTTATNTLSVSISASPASGITPLPVSFSATVSGGSAPYSYSWAFGDGGTSTGSTPTHTFQTAGVYLVQLTMLDSLGDSSSASTRVSVSPQVTTTQSSMTTVSASGVPPPVSVQPPGLPVAWDTSNMSVQAKTITSQIFIPGGVDVSNVESTSEISYMAYGQSNGAVLQLGFSNPGPVNLSIQTREAPSSVWANSTRITSWTYANGVLSISADPSTITVFFPTSSAIPVSEIILVLIIIVAFGAALGASLRRH